MIKLSLIIPYYNTYEYTIRLLRELRLQKTDEVEVILVDDGCNEVRFDEFTEFTIVHKEHRGACASWNEGIRLAQGKYIGFIDSDDMIMMNYVEELTKAIDQELADEILFDWLDFNRNRVFVQPYSRAVWKAIYRKEIVPFFDETRVHHTDSPFYAQLRRTPHTQYRLNMTLYIYRSQREGSIMWKYRQNYYNNITNTSQN